MESQVFAWMALISAITTLVLWGTGSRGSGMVFMVLTLILGLGFLYSVVN